MFPPIVFGCQRYLPALVRQLRQDSATLAINPGW